MALSNLEQDKRLKLASAPRKRIKAMLKDGLDRVEAHRRMVELYATRAEETGRAVFMTIMLSQLESLNLITDRKVSAFSNWRPLFCPNHNNHLKLLSPVNSQCLHF